VTGRNGGALGSDGYTALIGDARTRAQYKKLPFDTLKDFQAASIPALIPRVLPDGVHGAATAVLQRVAKSAGGCTAR